MPREGDEDFGHTGTNRSESQDHDSPQREPHSHVLYPLTCDGCGVQLDLEIPAEIPAEDSAEALGYLMFEYGYESVVREDDKCYAFCTRCQSRRPFKKNVRGYLDPPVYPYCTALHAGGTLCGERLTMHIFPDPEPPI